MARLRLAVLQLKGACRRGPAFDVTLADRLEVAIRALHPSLSRLSARGEPGISTGRRMPILLATRAR